MKTQGDMILDKALSEIGGKGLFVKEIEEALLDGRADVAVHSAKDLPAALAPGLRLASFPERADARDAVAVVVLAAAEHPRQLGLDDDDLRRRGGARGRRGLAERAADAGRRAARA